MRFHLQSMIRDIDFEFVVVKIVSQYRVQTYLALVCSWHGVRCSEILTTPRVA